MEPKIWFILSDSQVTGPYDSTEIEARLSSAKDPQVWGRGQSEWMNISRWRQFVKSSSAAETQQPKAHGTWKIRFEGTEQPSLKYPELISYLKTLTDFSVVDVCSEGSSAWKEIYAFPQLTADLGISRRTHPRVPIIGKLVCKHPKGELTCRAISISEGGVGVNDAQDLKLGERFKVTLTSPNLYTTINTTCDVVYVGNDGYAGLRFVGLPTEFKSSIIEYVKKFATA